MLQPELHEIEQQLRCPSGELGVKFGHEMHASNLGMTLRTIARLDIQDGERVLELGHGNCGHLAEITAIAPHVRYVGLETSTLMKQQAIKLNKSLIANHDIAFQHYDGVQIPYPDNSFDKIFSVNTLYFWSPAQALRDEIARVLKPNGLALLTYAQKQFMKTLPFVGETFQLYDSSDVAQLVKHSPLQVIEFINENDRAKSKSGQMVGRQYSVAVLQKTSN